MKNKTQITDAPAISSNGMLGAVKMDRNNVAKDILCALLQNPERYKYIAKLVDTKKISQEDANLKNVNKAFKIADTFLSTSNASLKKELIGFAKWLDEGFNNDEDYASKYVDDYIRVRGL